MRFGARSPPVRSRSRKPAEEYSLGCTQYHFNMEAADLSTGTLEEYKKNPGFATKATKLPPRRFLYTGIQYPGQRLGYGHRSQ